MASDEDSGGFLTSAVTFQVAAGTEYRIAVDGFGGAVGNIIFSWALELSAVVIPRIVQQPESQSVRAGDPAELRVIVESPEALAYQWYFNGAVLAGETEAILAFSNFQLGHAGEAADVLGFASLTSPRLSGVRPGRRELSLHPSD